MSINEEYVALFNEEYSELKPELSHLSITMIDTMNAFIKKEVLKEKIVFTRKEVLIEIKKISEVIEQKHSSKLKDKLSSLINEIENNKYYIDSLIKLECALGIYPNDFFLKRAKIIFYNDIFKPIIWGHYEDEYMTQIQKKK